MESDWSEWAEALEAANKKYEDAQNELFYAKQDFMEAPGKYTTKKLMSAEAVLRQAWEEREELRASFQNSCGFL